MIHLSIASAYVVSALQQLPRRDEPIWDSTSQQLIDGVVAPTAGILDDLWNWFVEPASQPTREPPQTIPGVQSDWSNPSKPEISGHPALGPVEINVFPSPSINE